MIEKTTEGWVLVGPEGRLLVPEQDEITPELAMIFEAQCEGKALLKQNCIPVYEPIESLRMINNVLVEVLPEGKYLTACYARLNRKAKRMSIVNGGHPPPVYLPGNSEGRLIKMKGDVLGIFSDLYFGHQDIGVNESDRFFMYTDGLIERPGDRKVWTDSLEHLLKKCGKLNEVPIGESAERLMDLMRDRTSKPEDDIVVLGIEV